MSAFVVKDIKAREILSTGSFPTVEAEVILSNGISARASVPRGTSEGSKEPRFCLDGDENRYHGMGVLTAIENIKKKILPALKGMAVTDQEAIDKCLNELDGKKDKSNLGVNSILAVSLACARTASTAVGQPLYQYLLKFFDRESVTQLPKPMAVVIEGGKHADNSTDFQEYMVLGLNENIPIAVRNCVEVYQELRKVLKENEYDVNVGYEGAYAFTRAKSNEEALVFIEEAVERCKLEMGKEIALGMDPAASEFFKKEDNRYHLSRQDEILTSDELINFYKKLKEKHKGIITLEDGLDEEDWTNWVKLCQTLGDEVLIIGDDLTVTNSKLVKQAIKTNAINGLLVKPNQAGTISETIKAIKTAKESGIKLVVSHRGGGETNDNFIVDLAVACEASYIKCGVSRGERVSKYNYLMEIASNLTIHL
ncbi:MAG: phosphopyruvate hydratase [Candidatus Aminicenantes bacterium]|nr:MAG: phosphopyruvate hydratase [Candidatus Aminicenantes bacterium]